VNRFWVSCVGVAVLGWPVWGQKVEVEKPDPQKIVHVQTALHHLTVLQMREPVSTVALGSAAFKVEWRDDKVFIEPTEPKVSTNLFVWTASGRFNYELDPAGDVPEMVFAIDQPIPDPPKINVSAKSAAESADPSPADILVAAKPVRLAGPVSEKNRVAVYITDLLEHDGQLLIRYSIRNGTEQAYVPGAPQVMVLKGPRYSESLYTLKNSQLLAPRLKSSGEIPIDVTKNEILSPRIEPGQEASGIVAIKLPQDHTELDVIRLVFLGSRQGPVSAAVVL
jgi:Conjugal transfer protein